jgi:polysaccharide pyruvyl transferase WcaK-like protein
MTKILFIGASPLSGNLGVPSLLVSTCKVLRTSIPDSEFKLFSSRPQKDSEQATRYGVEVVEGTLRQFGVAFLRCLLWASLNRFGLNVSFLLNDKILEEYRNADVIIDILGISFTDFFPNTIGYMLQSVWLLTGTLLKKPIVKFTQDMGPFENKVNKYLAKLCLNRLGFILVRGEITKEHTKKLGINRPIYVHPDTSFVLEPAPIEKVNRIMKQEKLDKKPLIGIVTSRQVERFIERQYDGDIKSQNRYTTTIAQIADHLIEKRNALIVFIPNEIAPQKGGYDDIYTAKKAYDRIENKSEVRLITTEYQAQELKGLIRECDLLITSRYHSTVAALSTCVPCLVIGWGFKYDQVMGIMGQKEFVCNFETMTLTEVQAKVDKLWHDREKVKAELASRMPSIEQSVLSGGKLVKDLLDIFSEVKEPYQRD